MKRLGRTRRWAARPGAVERAKEALLARRPRTQAVAVAIAGAHELRWLEPDGSSRLEQAVDCAMCGALAIVALPPSLLARQPDDTTHVCHPILGGCNHGFSATCPVCAKRDPRRA